MVPPVGGARVGAAARLALDLPRFRSGEVLGADVRVLDQRFDSRAGPVQTVAVGPRAPLPVGSLRLPVLATAVSGVPPVPVALHRSRSKADHVDLKTKLSLNKRAGSRREGQNGIRSPGVTANADGERGGGRPPNWLRRNRRGAPFEAIAGRPPDIDALFIL